MTRSTEFPESERFSLDLGDDLTVRLRARATVNRRSADAVVADAVEEYLATHPDHEQVRAAGLAAMREHQAEHGAFTEEEPAATDAWADRLMGPADDEQGGPPAGDPPDGRGV
ncbi:hypothetical protein [Streptomyces europaeiscabiei]|uniref:hypothetical protein n=1 Tax=Streptomyces europaeiscabiei TaxID=146819 RepID=UPI0029BD4E15|nr:hypothetical protein [Streptomyces europaeiscabiei]MDX3618531.1 hypothetical protein [Streptomyces europaeiscabiei]